MTWLRIGFDHAITHAVHASLSLHLISDMLDRGHPIKDFERDYGREHAASLGGNPAAITDWAFDIGGMWTKGEPTSEIEVDDFKIQIACSHWTWVLGDLRRSKLRRFSDGTPYHKLKFWHHATVLSANQHASVLRQVDAGAARAVERLAAWDSERAKAVLK